LALVPHHDSGKGRYREISGKNYILTLLQRLVQQRNLVSIFFPGNKEHFTSTVLSIEPREGYLLLDQIFPQLGQQLVLQAEKLHLYAYFDGSALGFTTQVLSQQTEEGLVYYRMAFPQSVNYLQRRDEHRVPVGEQDIVVELLDHDGKAYKGRLHDISPAGIGIQLVSPEIFEKKGIYRFGLYPPGEEAIHAELEISGFRREEGIDTPIVGGLFRASDRRTDSSLGRLVVELERRHLRARWGGSQPAAGKKEQAN
jgi:c-di-GMP-binding flagellar brake protein YcgR